MAWDSILCLRPYLLFVLRDKMLLGKNVEKKNDEKCFTGNWDQTNLVALSIVLRSQLPECSFEQFENF